MSKKPRVRSPQYPYIGLRDAVEKAQELYDYAKRNSVGVEGAVKHMGFSGDTGSARKTLAALKYYGLINQLHGSKELTLSDRALRILLDHEGSEERKNAIHEAFMSPKIYSYMWNKWHDELPHDNEIKSHLIFNKGFNESRVFAFINDYKQSLEYASIAPIEYEDENINDQFQGENDQVIEKSDNSQVFAHKIERRQVMKSGTQQATFPLDEGEVIFQWPESLSQTSLEDLETWLDLLKRKIQRSVKDPSQGAD